MGAAHAAQLSEVVFWRGQRRVAIRMPMGAAIDRGALDAGIASAAQSAGAAVWDNTAATVADDSHADFRTVALRRGGEVVEPVRARVVVASDGLGHPSLAELPEFRSTIAGTSRVGLGVANWDEASDVGLAYAAGTLHMAVADRGYLGVTRLGDGRLCIAAAVDRNVLRGVSRGDRSTAGAWMNETLASCGLPAIAGLATAPIKGTPLLTRRTSRVAGRRILVVGDAAGYIEPITGEGITWALVGAAALAPVATRGFGVWPQDVESDWTRALNLAVVRRQTINRGLAAALRRPSVARLLFAAAAAWPGAVTPIARRLNRPLKQARMAA
jgi:flavin-dependent dehydrogenase